MRRLLAVIMLLLLGASSIVGASGSQTEPATPQAPSSWHFPIAAHNAVWNNPYTNAPMVLIPGGEFKMGCSPFVGADVCRTDETPLHDVWIDTFWMDRYEVTNGQYEMCVADGGCTPPELTDVLYMGQPQQEWVPYYGEEAYTDYPVVWVDWYQANAYCAWKGKRLPTEAEWEKAARGNSDTRIWPWGDQYPSCARANYRVSINPTVHCVGMPTKVGSYPLGLSPYWVYDMAGNVWEWVADWYTEEYYSWSPYSNPTGPSTGTWKSIRGGAYGAGIAMMRTAFRHTFPVEMIDGFGGFRCAKDG